MTNWAERGRTASAVWMILSLVALVFAVGGCGDDNSASARLDRVDTVDGIKVAVTSCEADPQQDAEGGIPQTNFSVAGTLESDEPRVGFTVHVSFLDGDDVFYETDLDGTYNTPGLEGQTSGFETSVVLSDEVADLQCKATVSS